MYKKILAKQILNGYFKTGDLAIYKNSNLKFVDRSKDIIIKGGVNIAPQEIDVYKMIMFFNQQQLQ